MAHEYSNPFGYEHQIGKVAGAQRDADPGDCNDFWDRDVRKKLEAAMKFYDRVFDPDSHIAVLLQAAREHLKTLPKPRPPKFQVVGIRQGARETYHFKFAHRNNAADFAAGWMATGKYCSVAIEQVP
jgi:hypothetical protein